MKVEKELMTVKETYVIEEKDTLRIETIGEYTKIFINNVEIKFVLKIEAIHEVNKEMKIKIERLFTQEDFDSIKNNYIEKGE